MASVRTQGSSALKMQTAPQRERQRVEAPSPQQRRRLLQQQRQEQQRRLLEAQRKEAKRRALARREVLKKMGILAYVCTLFAVLSVVVIGYARVADIQMQNNALSKQMNVYNTQIADLQLQLSQKTDLQSIREQAQNRLNMNYPKPYQILEVELSDTTAVAAGGDVSNQSGGI